jgi:hypothetical protein
MAAPITAAPAISPIKKPFKEGVTVIKSDVIFFFSPRLTFVDLNRFGASFGRGMTGNSGRENSGGGDPGDLGDPDKRLKCLGRAEWMPNKTKLVLSW